MKKKNAQTTSEYLRIQVEAENVALSQIVDELEVCAQDDPRRRDLVHQLAVQTGRVGLALELWTAAAKGELG